MENKLFLLWTVPIGILWSPFMLLKILFDSNRNHMT